MDFPSFGDESPVWTPPSSVLACLNGFWKRFLCRQCRTGARQFSSATSLSFNATDHCKIRSTSHKEITSCPEKPAVNALRVVNIAKAGFLLRQSIIELGPECQNPKCLISECLSSLCTYPECLNVLTTIFTNKDVQQTNTVCSTQCCSKQIQ